MNDIVITEILFNNIDKESFRILIHTCKEFLNKIDMFKLRFYKKLYIFEKFLSKNTVIDNINIQSMSHFVPIEIIMCYPNFGWDYKIISDRLHLPHKFILENQNFDWNWDNLQYIYQKCGNKQLENLLYEKCSRPYLIHFDLNHIAKPPECVNVSI